MSTLNAKLSCWVVGVAEERLDAKPRVHGSVDGEVDRRQEVCFLCLELSEWVVTCAAREPVTGPAHSGVRWIFLEPAAPSVGTVAGDVCSNLSCLLLLCWVSSRAVALQLGEWAALERPQGRCRGLMVHVGCTSSEPHGHPSFLVRTVEVGAASASLAPGSESEWLARSRRSPKTSVRGQARL